MQDTTVPLSRMRRIVRGASVIWVALTLAYAVGYVTTLNPVGWELVLLVIGCAAVAVVPVAMAWALVIVAERPAPAPTLDPTLAERIGRLERSLAAQEKRLTKAETAIRAPAPTAPVPEPPKPTPQAELDSAAQQGDLPLTGGADGVPLTLTDTIQALNFPQDIDDQAGFAVLARALASRELSKLLQASEDCLNLLSQLGLYMDDLLPAPATAEDWRQFARGGTERAALLPLTGINDREALLSVQAATRSDPIFRDAALHFQRQFDQMLTAVAPGAADDALLNLLDTRSGRAFVLLVQVSGMGQSKP
ncbi:MAG: hypothetical protein AAGB10_01660 [Pseudomonadota bacterium]